MNSFMLLTTSFICGSVIMILELIGFRLFAPYFGYSIYVWGSLIGIIMVSMTIGYFLGGKLADVKPHVPLLYIMVLAADLYLLLMIFIYKIILPYLAEYGIIYGSIISSVIFYFVPMILLSMVSPFIIKLLSNSNTVGFTAGKIYGTSTFGGIFGVFFSTFYLIPNHGIQTTLNFCFVSLLILIVIYFIQKSKKALILLSLIFLLFIDAKWINNKKSERIIFEKESPYNHVVVLKEDNALYLVLNNSSVIQSIYLPDKTITNSVFDIYLSGLILTDPTDILILGLGAGTTVNLINTFFKDVQIDAVEIDPVVIDVSKKFFNLNNYDNVRIYEDDARPFLIRSKKLYNVIELDIYQGGAYVPFYVVTKEFFELIHMKLHKQGIFLMNVLDWSDSGIILNPIANTAATIFPSLYIVRYGSNYVIIATKERTNLDEIKTKLEHNKIYNFDGLFHSLKKFVPSNKHRVFTDDCAPVEKLTYKMLKEIP